VSWPGTGWLQRHILAPRPSCQTCLWREEERCLSRLLHKMVAGHAVEGEKPRGISLILKSMLRGCPLMPDNDYRCTDGVIVAGCGFQPTFMERAS